MSDLVERLRCDKPIVYAPKDSRRCQCLKCQAADEIKRLQAERDYYKTRYERCADYKDELENALLCDRIAKLEKIEARAALEQTDE